MPELLLRSPAASEAAEVAHLAARSFVEAFGADNSQPDMEEYVATALSPRALELELRDPRNTFRVGEASGRLVGYWKLRRGAAPPCVRGAQPIELHRIYLLQEAVGRGWGRCLFEDCYQVARADHRTLWLGVWEHNDRALGFYRRLGFETVGSHDFELGQDVQTDLILQLELE